MNTTTPDRVAWERARLALLEKEKAHVRATADLAAERRKLPRLRIDTDYRFDTPQGQRSLGDLFGERSQLIVQHFMLAPGASAGCPLCSFWADSFSAMLPHLAARDISFAAVSRASVAEIEHYRQRMGWTFPWVSSGNTSFNADFGVSPTEAQKAAGQWRYNYAERPYRMDDLPGASVFQRDDDGAIYLTYATFERGLDPLNAAYAYIDLTPKGRDEASLPWPMAWVKRHDEY